MAENNEKPTPDHEIGAEVVAEKPRKRGFQPGHPRYGGRKRGVPNKTTADIRRALLEGPARVGDSRGKGGLAGYCEQAARELAEKNERASYLSTLSKMLPPARADAAADSGGVIGTINIISVPSGEFLCTHEEAETLRKLKEFPGMMAAVLALADAALWGDAPTIDLPGGDSVELLARLSRIPGAMNALRIMLSTYLSVAEEKHATRQARAVEIVEPQPIEPVDTSNVAILKPWGRRL